MAALAAYRKALELALEEESFRPQLAEQIALLESGRPIEEIPPLRDSVRE